MQPDYKILYRNALADKIYFQRQFDELFREVRALKIFQSDVIAALSLYEQCKDE